MVSSTPQTSIKNSSETGKVCMYVNKYIMTFGGRGNGKPEQNANIKAHIGT